MDCLRWDKTAEAPSEQFEPALFAFDCNCTCTHDALAHPNLS